MMNTRPSLLEIMDTASSRRIEMQSRERTN
jgi:hypothetical protein